MGEKEFRLNEEKLEKVTGGMHKPDPSYFCDVSTVARGTCGYYNIGISGGAVCMNTTGDWSKPECAICDANR